MHGPLTVLNVGNVRSFEVVYDFPILSRVINTHSSFSFVTALFNNGHEFSIFWKIYSFWRQKFGSVNQSSDFTFFERPDLSSQLQFTECDNLARVRTPYCTRQEFLCDLPLPPFYVKFDDLFCESSQMNHSCLEIAHEEKVVVRAPPEARNSVVQVKTVDNLLWFTIVYKNQILITYCEIVTLVWITSLIER